MAREIERKYLVKDESWRNGATHSELMSQGYLAFTDRTSVRVRIAGSKAWLNFKSARLGIERLEFEYEIPVQDATVMLAELSSGPQVEKTRHYVPFNGHTWEIDEFMGENSGLVVAEIELDDTAETFAAPPWLGEEVSYDPRYYNVNLVDTPYSRW